MALFIFAVRIIVLAFCLLSIKFYNNVTLGIQIIGSAILILFGAFALDWFDIVCYLIVGGLAAYAFDWKRLFNTKPR